MANGNFVFVNFPFTEELVIEGGVKIIMFLYLTLRVSEEKKASPIKKIIPQRYLKNIRNLKAVRVIIKTSKPRR